jgi:hypothetical protein
MARVSMLSQISGCIGGAAGRPTSTKYYHVVKANLMTSLVIVANGALVASVTRLLSNLILQKLNIKRRIDYLRTRTALSSTPNDTCDRPVRHSDTIERFTSTT